MKNTDDIVSDLRSIIDLSQKQAYQAVNTALVHRNWLIGYWNSRRRTKR